MDECEQQQQQLCVCVQKVLEPLKNRNQLSHLNKMIEMLEIRI